MSFLSEMYKSLDDLPSTVPVFPLGGALLLPRGILPLNIFEPRYLAMVDAALKENRLIGMVQPKPGKARDALYSVGCLGRLTAYQETEDGRYLITLTGICRFSIEEEMLNTMPYRTCKISTAEFKSDLRCDFADNSIDRTEFLKTFSAYLEANNLEVDWDSLQRASDETLVNAFCMMSPYGLAEKQAFLEAESLRKRADLLIAITERDLAASDQPAGRSLQ